MTYILELQWGEEGQPQQFLVRATFSSFSRPSYLKILVLSKIFFKRLILAKIRIFIFNLPTLGNKWNIEFSLTNFKFVKKLIYSQNDVLQISICLQWETLEYILLIYLTGLGKA